MALTTPNGSGTCRTSRRSVRRPTREPDQREPQARARRPPEMWRVVPILMVAVAVSCGHASSGVQTSDTGVRGTVMLGPLCPVEVAGSRTPCPDQPVNGFVTASDEGGEVARVHTDVIGRFEMA